MIYTVTLNPSIDYIVEVEDFKINTVNRMEREAKYPGGKGINVSRVLNRIGVPTKALGFLGGFTGSFIKEALISEGIDTDFVTVEGDTRINIKLKALQETEINGNGPIISPNSLDTLQQKLDEMREGDYLVLAGSVPSTLPEQLYAFWTGVYGKKGIKVVVDARGKVLEEALKHRPFMVKPNHHELAELFNVSISSLQDIVFYGRKVVEMGAQNVIVSMAGEGALLITKNKVYKATVPNGEVVNSVGAGDSLVAGFTGTFSETDDIIKSFQFGVASGSATAFSSDLCTKEKIDSLLEQVRITEV
ncbi:1-phosphofructokinase [Peribacillus alkalitolerans]|uniref:1-phosphofructokinase n=1 Tax=Peribacillus alkalitolerans TaxID=1550385 RepID=UPI0013D7F6B0|nr:1-phosphofructokinase [Peribacillus alkalitolerans]